ncbi:hypothetical protein Tco_0158102 [Tanacetum coccineum]
MLGKDLQEEDFAKRMVELVNQRKKYFAEERAKAKRSKPMTQSQLRQYMMNFLKNQGTWKITQLKKLTFEEVKEEFDKLVKQVESFVPMNLEATKADLKRFGEELQVKTAKRQRIGDKDDHPVEEKIGESTVEEPAKKMGKRKKQMARKGMHSDKPSDDDSEKDEDDEKEDSPSGTDIPINPVPVSFKPSSVISYKIIKMGKKGVYQIVREDGTDKVYMSFGVMLKEITRDDLTELYRVVMERHGTKEPADEDEKVIWRNLRTIVHCLNLESTDIYMLTERSYPLPAQVCKTMLDKKLQGMKTNEDCYKLLKMIEKQAGVYRP